MSEHRIYRLAFWIALLVPIGILLELLMIGHYEDGWQVLPIVALLVFVVMVILKKRIPLYRVLRVICLITMIVGLIGIALHLNNNLEFELEMYPNLTGSELISRALTGALPVLAPGALIPVGLIGFLLLELTKHKN